jgi:hypothetical protein
MPPKAKHDTTPESRRRLRAELLEVLRRARVRAMRTVVRLAAEPKVRFSVAGEIAFF